jgi:hypothetical protein
VALVVQAAVVAALTVLTQIHSLVEFRTELPIQVVAVEVALVPVVSLLVRVVQEL